MEQANRCSNDLQQKDNKTNNQLYKSIHRIHLSAFHQPFFLISRRERITLIVLKISLDFLKKRY